jgi:hypothetical protein
VGSDPDEEVFFLAGELVPPGVYVRVDAWPERRVVLAHSGVLPASLDGQVACYRRRPDPVAAPTGRRVAEAADDETRNHRAVSA